MPKRSYFEEITEIIDSWEKTLYTPPLIDGSFNNASLKGTAFCIGSGGSLVAAKLWQQVYESHELGFAKTMTPYEYQNQQIPPDIVVLFSASGNNHDILDAFRRALESGCKIVVFTVSHKSPLLRLVTTNSTVACAIRPSNTYPKDGFLAVNSTLVLAGLIYQIEDSIFNTGLSKTSPVEKAVKDYLCNPINLSHKIHTIQVVVSEWGNAAGIDLETRLSESGIIPCLLTEPRSFGHGRFIWLDLHKDNTLMVLIYTEDSAKFMEKFSKTLPNFIPRYSICSKRGGTWGAIYCITMTILMVADIAKIYNIDPGKPEVPDWGRKLHGLKSDKIVKARTTEYPALNTAFSGMIIDIDGTLVDTKSRFEPIEKDVAIEINRLLDLGLRLGFATGRGGSAQELLSKAILKKHQESIILGLYNGTVITNLLNQNISNIGTGLPYYDDLLQLINSIVLGLNVEVVGRPTQISVRCSKPSICSEIKANLIKRLGQVFRHIKIVGSAHSIDIIPWWGSKLNVVQALGMNINSNILCIGDQGQPGGNDEELLSWQPSISVGKYRPSSNSCLWVGKNEELRESKGVLSVLKAIIYRDGFCIDKDKLMPK
ncbi:MAG: HAD hydrolase family protein [Syntrophomonadaceae bacterium]